MNDALPDNVRSLMLRGLLGACVNASGVAKWTLSDGSDAGYRDEGPISVATVRVVERESFGTTVREVLVPAEDAADALDQAAYAYRGRCATFDSAGPVQLLPEIDDQLYDSLDNAYGNWNR